MIHLFWKNDSFISSSFIVIHSFQINAGKCINGPMLIMNVIIARVLRTYIRAHSFVRMKEVEPEGVPGRGC